MSEGLEKRLREALGPSPLAERLASVGAPFLERSELHAPLEALRGEALAGLARVLASSAESARYLVSRPVLVERIASGVRLETRAAELEALRTPADPQDLELYLDAIRLVRRDETLLAGWAHLAGATPFERVSEFLSVVAESCVRWALNAAGAVAAEVPLAVVGMGKIAGREFTYQSDLDVIFLYPDSVGDGAVPARIAQRLISYLTSMTGAGVAYPVDSRLRPSGNQGALVSTYESFERYQRERAAVWEHLALMRARALAGAVEATDVLERVQRQVVGSGSAVWPAVAEMGARVVHERGADGSAHIPFKAGRGGLMHIEFLAAGALLERGRTLAPALPSVVGMLRAGVEGPALEPLLEAYALLRRVEACLRWLLGRPVESLPTGGETPALVADLVEPGLEAAVLLARIEAAREHAGGCFDRVVASGSVAALGAALSRK